MVETELFIDQSKKILVIFQLNFLIQCLPLRWDTSILLSTLHYIYIVLTQYKWVYIELTGKTQLRMSLLKAFNYHKDATITCKSRHIDLHVSVFLFFLGDR